MRPGLRAWDILRGRLRASLSHFMETACVFVDGENLRHSIVELFEPEFQAPDYLPRAARWSDFFEHLVKKSGAKWLLRSYWYVVGEMDFWPWGLSAALRKRDYELLERVLSKDRDYPAGITLLRTFSNCQPFTMSRLSFPAIRTMFPRYRR